MITPIHLAKGAHYGNCTDPERCLMEWYNWLSRQVHTDSCPPDVSPVLHEFGLALNDLLPDAQRQELVRYLPLGAKPSPLAGSRGDGLDEQRGYLVLDWLIRAYTPAWLDLAGLAAEATALRDLRRIVTLAAAQAAVPVVRTAGDAAWDAARNAAGDAAWAAARNAAWAAAGDAAGDAARNAARDAARDALQPAVDALQASAILLFGQMVAPSGRG